MSDLSVKRGDTWSIQFLYKNAEDEAIDLTDATARLDLRLPGSSTPVLSISSATGELTINGVAGTIDLLVAYATMNELEPAEYNADMEVTYPNNVRRSTATFVVEVIEDITR